MGPITVAALCRSQEQDGGVSLLQPRQPQPATNALSACRLDRAAAGRPHLSPRLQGFPYCLSETSAADGSCTTEALRRSLAGRTEVRIVVIHSISHIFPEPPNSYYVGPRPRVGRLVQEYLSATDTICWNFPPKNGNFARWLHCNLVPHCSASQRRSISFLMPNGVLGLISQLSREGKKRVPP